MKRFKKWADPRLAQISLYVIATFLIIFLLYKALGSTGTVLAALGRGLHWLFVILKPLVTGFAAAYILYPVALFFEKKFLKRSFFQTRQKTAHSLGVAVTWLLIAVVVFLLLSLVISAVYRELRTFQADDLVGFVVALTDSFENLLKQISEWLGQIGAGSGDTQETMQSLQKMLQKLGEAVGEYAKGILPNLPGFLTNLLFTVIFGIYFMLDARGLSRYWDRVLKAMTGRRTYAGVHRFIHDADTVFSGYIRGQLMDALIMCILVSVSLSIIGVPFAVIIGILTGIGNLIPYVGPIVAYGSTILVCLVHFDIQKLIIAVIAICVIQTIDGNVINPRLLSHSISVHPMLVIASLIVGGAAGGIVGMLLAVPVAGLLKLYFDRFIQDVLSRRNQEPVNVTEVFEDIEGMFEQEGQATPEQEEEV